MRRRHEPRRDLAERQAQTDAAARAAAELNARTAAAGQATAERAAADADAARSAAEAARAQAVAAQQAAEAQTRQAQGAAAQSEQDKTVLREQLRTQLNVILDTRETARGLIVNLSDVLFDTASSTLKPGAREKLARVSGILVSHDGLRLAVEGHTDSVGTDDYNQGLSERRARIGARVSRGSEVRGRLGRRSRLWRRPASRDQRHGVGTTAESAGGAGRVRRHHRPALSRESRFDDFRRSQSFRAGCVLLYGPCTCHGSLRPAVCLNRCFRGGERIRA